jgi:hypothetical protein
MPAIPMPKRLNIAGSGTCVTVTPVESKNTPDALCRYLGHPLDTGTVDLTICAIHVDALQVVIYNDITADGGDLGNKVLDGIERVAEKTVSHDKRA